MSIQETCIYCRSHGPFTAEHVISAGLGGDDRRFMLHDMVCKSCNTDVFSPLECAFLRNSTTALGRIFMQPEGRKRGKKANPPKLEARSKTLVTTQGQIVEIELGSHGRPTILPQLILTGDRQCSITGPEEASLRSFVADLHRVLDASVICVYKDCSIDPPLLRATNLKWEPDGYHEESSGIVDKNPEVYVWRVAMESTTESAITSQARLYKRPNGQIELRVANDIGLAQALTLFRKSLHQVDFTTIELHDISKPLVKLELSFRIDVTERVLAKIGINILAYLLGSEYVCHPKFQSIKTAIRTGTPQIRSFPPEGTSPFATLFSGLPSTSHGFLLAGLLDSEDTCAIVLVARLHGSQIEALTLGQGLPIPKINLPIFFTVDYLNHRIDKYEMMDFVKSYPFNMDA